jgi:hypothetical protein
MRASRQVSADDPTVITVDEAEDTEDAAEAIELESR